MIQSFLLWRVSRPRSCLRPCDHSSYLSELQLDLQDRETELAQLLSRVTTLSELITDLKSSESAFRAIITQVGALSNFWISVSCGWRLLSHPRWGNRLFQGQSRLPRCNRTPEQSGDCANSQFICETLRLLSFEYFTINGCSTGTQEGFGPSSCWFCIYNPKQDLRCLRSPTDQIGMTAPTIMYASDLKRFYI